MISSFFNRIYNWFVPSNSNSVEIEVINPKRCSTDAVESEQSVKRIKLSMESKSTDPQTGTKSRKYTAYTSTPKNDAERITEYLPPGKSTRSSSRKKSIQNKPITISDDELDDDIQICNGDVSAALRNSISKNNPYGSLYRKRSESIDLTENSTSKKNTVIDLTNDEDGSINSKQNGPSSSKCFKNSICFGENNDELGYSFSRNHLTLSEATRMREREVYKNLLKHGSNVGSGRSIMSPKNLHDKMLLPVLNSIDITSKDLSRLNPRNKSSISLISDKDGDNNIVQNSVITHKKTHINVDTSKSSNSIMTNNKYNNVVCKKCNDQKSESLSSWLNSTGMKTKTNGSDAITDILQNYERKQKIRDVEIEQLNESLRNMENKKFNDELEARFNRLKLWKEPEEIEEPEPEIVTWEITNVMWQKAQNIMSNKDPSAVLLQTNESTIRLSDIQTLFNVNWLNDEVINTYLKLIADRSQQRKNYPSVHSFNTFFFSKLQNGYNGVRRWTKKIDIFSKDMIIIPIHHGYHWCLAIINFKCKVITYYDSMGCPGDKCLTTLHDYLIKEHLDKKKTELEAPDDWKLISTMKKTPQQLNGFDCGVFVCITAEFVARNAPLSFTQDDMPKFRQKMVYEILTGELIT